MADILGLKFYSKSDGTEKLVTAYGNDIGVFDGSSIFVGQGRNLSAVKMEFDVYLDYLIGTNRVNANQVYDGINWINGGMRARMPIAKYVKTVGTTAYLADLVYVSTNFRSRVWKSSLPKNNDIQWGFESGTNLAQTSGSKVITSANAGFITYGIKTGDPFFITTGANAGEYVIDTIDADQQITLTEAMKNTATGSTYWTGSNWFDARTNDSDYIRGLGENDDQLLVFKRESLNRYDGTVLRKVKGVPGTTSHRSIINLRESTYYFHDTGIYKYSNGESILISRPIEDYVEAISSSNYDSVVSWIDGDLVYIFVGDLTDIQKGIDIDNAVLIYNTAAQNWNIGALNNILRAGTIAIESEARVVYL